MKGLNHLLLFFLFVFGGNFCFAQIAITEVYYDTPFSEREALAENHHTGEFVELFNYTTSDIDIGGWRLINFTIPQGTVIKSGDFIIVAYAGRENEPSYFPEFFPNVQGNEDKILYQSDFVLNNFKFNASLEMTSINGIDLSKIFQVHEVGLKLPKDQKTEHNYFNPDTFDGSGNPNYGFDYYKKSLQLENQNQFQDLSIIYSSQDFNSSPFRNAQPMSLDYPVELIPLESIPRLMDAIYGSYDHFIGNSGVLDLLNNVCDNYVASIYENTIDDDIFSEECPEYDEAGNFIGILEECPFGRQIPEKNKAFDFAPEKDYASMIWVAPNPTHNTTTIYCEKEIEDLITDVVVVPLNGATKIPFKFNKSDLRAEINLAAYPSGIYIVRFQFISGQIVTKSIIKI